MVLLANRSGVSPIWRLFFVTGFLGSYTTFSSFSYEVALLLYEGAYAPATVYVLGSFCGGLLAAGAGVFAASRLS